MNIPHLSLLSWFHILVFCIWPVINLLYKILTSFWLFIINYISFYFPRPTIYRRLMLEKRLILVLDLAHSNLCYSKNTMTQVKCVWELLWPLVCVCALVAQSCPTLCDPMDCSPPGASVCGILQARILEWVAIPFLRESCQQRDWTQVSHMAGRFFAIWATRFGLYFSSINWDFSSHKINVMEILT